MTSKEVVIMLTLTRCFEDEMVYPEDGRNNMVCIRDNWFERILLRWWIKRMLRIDGKLRLEGVKWHY